MSNIYNQKLKYIDILNRFQKNSSFKQILFFIIKQNLTNNVVYYFFCVIFRYIHLISISGDYTNAFNDNMNEYSFQNYLKSFTCHNLIKNSKLSYPNYLLICILLYIISFIMIINYIHCIRKIKSYNKYSNIIPFQNKIINIIGHLLFLLFPFIIEFLSFPYYIYFFPNTFVIKKVYGTMLSLFIIIIINTFLIVMYNIFNIIYIICSNKIFSTNIVEAYLKINSKKNQISYKPIRYKCSNLIFYLFIFLQNFPLLSLIEDYFNNKGKFFFKIEISILIFTIIFLLFFKRLHDYNCQYFMNILINVLLLFCFNSIIIDLFIYLSKNEMKNKTHVIIYLLIKIFLSYLLYFLFILKTHKLFKEIIPEILFEKIEPKKKYFINSFCYLNQIMKKIKDNNDINSVFLIIEMFHKHIYKCNNNFCNCKLLEPYIKKEQFSNADNEKIKNYISVLLIILNHLYECAFINSDYYSNYELVILLAEHYCHLRNNPTISFSLINTLIINQRNKMSSSDLNILFELSQKYLYYIYGYEKQEIEEEKKNQDKSKLLIGSEKRLYFKRYFLNLKMSLKIKKLVNLYIDNHIKITKYRNIFEESLKINYDESNEYITSVNIIFFEISSEVEGVLDKVRQKNINNKNENYIKKKYEKKTNLNKIINLLKIEKVIYGNILSTINTFKETQNIPVFMVFKLYLFFDIFEGGKFPDEISLKMHEFLTNKKIIYNGLIKNSDYSKLNNKYMKQNSTINSNYYAIFEYKYDLRTKYFSEDCALKLGYKQIDIVDKKLNVLMPKEFYKSHQYLIKQLIIGNQIKHLNTNKSFLFNSSCTTLYPIIFDSLLLYNISKNLSIIIEISFFMENEYKFMLNSNFDLLANSKNFEIEYYLNHKILQQYGIKIMDILKIKPEKINKKFNKTIQKIHNEKLIRQAKIEEYFIKGFYLSLEDQNNDIEKSSHFNNTKNKILLKILNSKIEKGVEDTINEIDEEKKFIHEGSIKEALVNPGQIIYYDTYNIILNKKLFIENLAKELTKIQDNDLVFDNDYSYMNNLIIFGKQQINELMTKNELANHWMKIAVKLTYYYDKPFYLISIDDEKKLYINISKEIRFENNTKFININNKKYVRNKKSNISVFKKPLKEEKTKVSFEENSKINISSNNANINNYSYDTSSIINKIDKYREQINKNKFMAITRFILLIVIICIFIFCFLVIYLQIYLIMVTDLILKSHYYNINTRQSMLNAYTKLLETIFSFRGLFVNVITSNENDYNFLYKKLSKNIKENSFNFTKFYIDYSLLIGKDFNLIYKKRTFYGLEGFWQEIEYNSSYASEIETVMYNLYNVNYSQFASNDIYNFLFFQNQESSHIKVETIFIKILYYFCVNYEYVYKDLFLEIQDSLYETFTKYSNQNMNYYTILELLGIFFYLIFLMAVIIYLFISNDIIIKNLIFLFLDFSVDEYDKIKGNNNNNMIIYKLFEFKILLDDFDLSRLGKYSKNLDKLNKNKNRNKLFSISNKNLSSILSSIENGFSVGKNKDPIKSISNKNIKTANINENNINNFSDKKNNNKIHMSKKNISSIPNDPDLSRRLFDNNNKLNMDNSSHDYLVGPDSNFIKDKLNNNNLFNENNMNNKNNNIFDNSNNNMSNNLFINNNNLNNNNPKKINIKKDINDLGENIQDIIINKSKNSRIFIFKIYLIIIVLIVLAILIFSVYKMNITFNFKASLNGYFTDFTTLTNRYSLLFYYFNLLRTTIILPKGERKEYMKILNNDMRKIYEKENQKFFEFVKNSINNYAETKKLNEILNYKTNATNLLNRTICNNDIYCHIYLTNSYGLFDSGADFSYKSFFNQINNIYMDYTKLFDQTSFFEIRMRLIGNYYTQFGFISQSINLIFENIQQCIFEKFLIDQNNFKNTFKNGITILNLSSMTISILAFIFVNVVIFLTISNFIEPIKDSIYRINCSFYYIKIYNLNYFLNSESIPKS